MSSNVKNTADLRMVLLDVIDEVRSKTISSQDASAISSLASCVLQSAKLDYEVARKNTGDKQIEILSTNLLTGISPSESTPPKITTTVKHTTEEIGNSDELPHKQKEKIIELKKSGKSLGQVMSSLCPKSKSENKAISDIYYNYIG